MKKSLCWIAILVFLTMLPVTGLVPILKPLVQDRFTLGPFAVHLFMSINMIAAAAAAPLMGALSDRLGRRRLWVVGAASLDAALFIAFLWAPTYGVMLMFRFLEGAAHITVLSLLFAQASASLEGRDSFLMGILGGALTLGIALGAALGGILGQIGVAVPLLLGGGIMVSVAIGSLVWVKDQSVPGAARLKPGEVSRLLREHRGLRMPLLFAFVERLAGGFFVASFPILCAVKWGMGPRSIGLMIAAYMLPMAISCYLVGHLAKRLPPRALLCWGGLIYAGLFAGIGFIDPAWLVLWMILCGAVSAVIFVPTLALIGQETPAVLKGSAMGLFNALGSLGFIVGPLFSGAAASYLAAWFDPAAAYTAVFVLGGMIVSATAMGSFITGAWTKGAANARTEGPVMRRLREEVGAAPRGLPGQAQGPAPTGGRE